MRSPKVTRAVLDEADVVAIRRAHAAGETQGAIAERFGVHRTTVNRVCRRNRWRDVGTGDAPRVDAELEAARR